MRLDDALTRREFGGVVAASSIATALSAFLPGAATAEETPAQEAGSIQIAMLVYPQMTALDLVGPLQFLGAIRNARIDLVWKNRDILVSDVGLRVQASKTFDECHKDLTILFSPGGSIGTLNVMNDDAVLDFMAERGKSAKYVTSVCTGALVLGAAGLLNGYKATTHWLAHDHLALFGAQPVKDRVVEDRNRITGAGVTAGMDFGLRLAAKLQSVQEAKSIQLMMEYDPHPPFQAGSPEGAGKEAADALRRSSAPLLAMIKESAKRTRSRRS
jgi:cyclohexyl-isocyanide hydratase